MSLLSTSILAQITADHDSSGAEYLQEAGLAFKPYQNLTAALDALSAARADAVVNSVGALDYAISARARGSAEMMRGLLAPALMGMPIPRRSPLREPLDETLVAITTGPDWPAIEAAYFGRR